MDRLFRSKARFLIGSIFLALVIIGIGIKIKLDSHNHNGQEMDTQAGNTPVDQRMTSTVSDAYVIPSTTSTRTPTEMPRKTPTITSTLTYYNAIPVSTIGATQIPPIVVTPFIEDSEYLYKDEIVELILNLGASDPAIGYLNLDNLQENGMETSDVILTALGGKAIFYQLSPANNAMNYPDPINLDFDSCVDHLSKFGNYPFPSFLQDPYCYLTNEGRIAIIQYVPDSITFDDELIVHISLKISVYKKQIERSNQ